MDNSSFQEVEQPAPLKIERLPYDTIMIEGVRYSCDIFRNFALPELGVLFSLKRVDDVLHVTIIRNASEAERFFFRAAYTPGGE